VRQLVDNRYRVIEPLGGGGMAEVYLVRDEVLGRDVALKVMSRRYAGDEEFVERFRREAQSAAALSHPNIVQVYDRGETGDGTYYIAMEYVAGGTLKDRILRKGPIPPQKAVAVTLQVARALRAAHERGVVHRDVKPQNILTTDSGEVKVTDFGIARAASSTTITRPGFVLGTADYISPEQAKGEPVDPRSDLYSLGVVLYEMLTGELPHAADTPVGMLAKHANERPRPPKELSPDVPEGVNGVTMRLLAKDPAGRHPDAASLIEDLERVGEGLPPAAATGRTRLLGASPTAPTLPRHPVGAEGARKSGKPRLRTSPLMVALILATLAFVAILALGSSWQGQRGQDATVEVPDLRGQELNEAKQNLSSAGFEVADARTEQSSKPAGTVVATDPPADSESEPGTTVTPIISGGPSEPGSTAGQEPKSRVKDRADPPKNGGGPQKGRGGGPPPWAGPPEGRGGGPPDR